jgi:hypothetical protein
MSIQEMSSFVSMLDPEKSTDKYHPCTIPRYERLDSVFFLTGRGGILIATHRWGAMRS